MQISTFWKQTQTFGQNFIYAVKNDRNVQIGLLALAAISLVGIFYLFLRSSKSQTNHPPSKNSTPSNPQSVEKKKNTSSTENTKKLKTEKIPSGKMTIPKYGNVELLSFGKARKDLIPGDSPQSNYIDCQFELILANELKNQQRADELGKKLELLENKMDHEELKKNITALFACCFHTSESHQEIYQLLIDIRREMGPINPEDKNPLGFLLNNLLTLLTELPLDHFPQMKIYWNEDVRKKLIPHLIETENFKPDNLLLAYIPGEKFTSPYMATTMDFARQLQFVALDYNQFLIHFNSVMDRLADTVYFSEWKEGHLIDTPLMKKMVRERNNSSVNQTYDLIQRANFFTYSWNAYHRLIEMNEKKERLVFDSLKPEVKINHLRALYLG